MTRTDTTSPSKRKSRLERVARRLVPAPYWSTADSPGRLLRTFAIAVSVRLVLMPIACHGDLISTYHRAWFALTTFRPGFWVPHELIETAFLALYSPFLRLGELLEWQGAPSVPVDFWLDSFAPHPQVFLALFLFKIPYLLCDLGIALVLLRLFEKAPAQGLRAVSMWLWNPVTIFVFYVFGRHDSISILFVGLAVLGLQRGRSTLGALAMGIALWSRFWPVLLLPFQAAIEAGGWRKHLRFFAVALAPVVFYNAVSYLDPVKRSPPAIRMATDSTFSKYVLGFALDVGWSHTLYVFPAVYLLLVLYAQVARPREDRVVRFSQYALCFLAAFYATSFFHPQYFTWFILFLVILRAGETRPVLRNLHYLQLAFFVPYTFYWKQTLAGFLLAPLAPDFFIGLPPPSDLIQPYYPALTLVNLARTGIATTCVFMAGWVLFGERLRAAPMPGSTT